MRILATMLVLLAAPVAARADVATLAATNWLPARDSSGGKPPTRLSQNARKLRIRYEVQICDGDDASAVPKTVRVRRRPGRIVVTVYVGQLGAVEKAPCAGLTKFVRTTISLKGRLGKRVVKDGGSSPAPTLVVPKL